MIKFLLLSALVAVAFAQPTVITDNHLEQWELFKVHHEKEYGNEQEEQRRKGIFLTNLKTIKEHNIKYERGETTFYMGVNEFTDLTNEEFHKRMSILRIPRGYNRTGEKFYFDENIELPKEVDWRKKGAVTPVKNQGPCSSSYAFSATGCLEGRTFVKTKKLVSLSEQNIVDCSEREGNVGCRFGIPDNAYDYIKRNGGIDSEESYPYEAKDGKCRYQEKSKAATVSDLVYISEGKEKELQAAVAKGPVSVAIDASQPSFQHYAGGIYIEPKCETHILDFSLVVVGYGKLKEGDYWLVKNQWGESWGVKGYLLIARNHKNMCGIATMASYPKV